MLLKISPSSKLLIILTVLFFVKMFLAILLPLTNDEAYTIAVARDLSLSFFDHPPIGFWSPILSAKLFGSETTLIFRLPFIFYGIGTTTSIFLIAKELYDEKSGLWAAVLYNMAPFFFFSGGLLIVPDGPLNLALSLAALSILKIHNNPSDRKIHAYWWLLGGSLALAMASKYQAYLFSLGCLFILILSSKRKLLFNNPGLFICFSIAILGVVPTFLWNLEHAWITFSFHGGRQGNTFEFSNLVRMIVANLIYLLPITLILSIQKFRLVFNLPNYIRDGKDQKAIDLIILSLPVLIMFLIVYLTSKNTFPHWIMPAWLLIIPLVSNLFSEINSMKFRYLLLASFLPIWLFLTLILMHTQTGMLTSKYKEAPTWDNTLEVFDWSQVEQSLDKLIQETPTKHIKKLAALNWFEGGQISTATKNKYNTVILKGDPHHFAYLKKDNRTSSVFLCKISLLNKKGNLINEIQKVYPKAQLLKILTLKRGMADYAHLTVILINEYMPLDKKL